MGALAGGAGGGDGRGTGGGASGDTAAVRLSPWPADPDPVGTLAASMAYGVHFGDQGPPPHCGGLIGVKQFDVVFAPAGLRKAVWVIDPLRRPPDPAGAWLDDLLSAACRLCFGVARGSARPVQGSPEMEFREYWADPALRKLVERVRVSCVREGGVVAESGTVNVETHVLPGADHAAAAFAAVCQCCDRRWGPGTLTRDAAKDFSYTYRPGLLAGTDTSVRCRYVIHRPGGAAVEAVVTVPYSATRSWEAILYAVRSHCAKVFGPGRLEYLPELGEVHFFWR